LRPQLDHINEFEETVYENNVAHDIKRKYVHGGEDS
jgi:hypothetical protein